MVDNSIRDDIAEIKATVTRIDDTLRGDGKTPGALTRLDRLEQSEGRRAKYLYAAVSAAFTALISVIWTWISGDKP